MLEQYSKEEILGFIEAGYKNLGDTGSKNACMALIRGLPGGWGAMGFAEDYYSVLQHLERLGIPKDYVPPRMLARRALALLLSFHQTIAELEKSSGVSVVETDAFMHESLHLLHSSGSVADAYLLSDESADMLLRFCGVLKG